jgi:hypothetical protein
MNKVIVFFLIIFLFSCSNKDYTSHINAKISKENKILYLNVELDYPIPKKLQENLKMFSHSNIKLNMKIYNSKNEIIFMNNIERVIKYDRWNNYYTIKDSYLLSEKKFPDFESIRKNINKFENIPFYFNNQEDITNQLMINYDFYLKSVDFIEPFKIIEYNEQLGNIKKMNNKYKFYVEK